MVSPAPDNNVIQSLNVVTHLCFTELIIMGKKGSSNGGAKRKISKVKRSNQKMNKMVKQGKVKPKTKPMYLPPSSRQPNKSEKGAEWLTPEVKKKWRDDLEQDRDKALDQLAEQVSGTDLEFLKKMNVGVKRKHDSDDDEDLEELERAAEERIEAERNSEKKVKGLLPIKTKSGVKQRFQEVEEQDEDEEDEAEGAGDEDEEEGEDDNINEGQQYSVVELYAQRKEVIAEMKITIGSLASNFLENPEERIMNLEKLVKMLDSGDQPKSVNLTIDRLAAMSILELLKHVTPGYPIKHQDLKEGERLKKDTLKLVMYESALLKCYKNYLVKLEKLVNMIKGKTKMDKATSKQATFFLSCMCQLLVAHPHFNFAKNILHAIIPILSSSNSEARDTVKNCLEEVFKSDMRGEISLEAVRLINHLVKSRKHSVRPEVVSVLLCLRIKHVDLDKEKNEEIDRKKMESRKKKLLEKSKISKQEKKRRKKLEALEKELLIARGEEGKKVKEKYFTEVTKLVFTIYFRILKSHPRSQLMGAVLEGLSKFAHIINIEFFSDLINVFQQLLESQSLSYRDTLLATGTVFKILSGQGESLNIDPTSFYTHLYSSLLSLSLLTSPSSFPLAMSSLHDMLISRRKKVSKSKVLAFTKRLSTVCLQLDHAGAMSTLALLRQLFTTHPITSQLLDSEHEVGSGIFDPGLRDPEHCNASNTTCWELSLLARHYHPTTHTMVTHVTAFCPSQGDKSLVQSLKLSPDKMYGEYTAENMSFNPPVKPPESKKKRGKMTPISTTPLDEIGDLSPDLDYHSSFINPARS